MSYQFLSCCLLPERDVETKYLAALTRDWKRFLTHLPPFNLESTAFSDIIHHDTEDLMIQE